MPANKRERQQESECHPALISRLVCLAIMASSFVGITRALIGLLTVPCADSRRYSVSSLSRAPIAATERSCFAQGSGWAILKHRRGANGARRYHSLPD
jgi:hypothetical protein